MASLFLQILFITAGIFGLVTLVLEITTDEKSDKRQLFISSAILISSIAMFSSFTFIN
ncbi:hypothetical protein [Gracilibacillus lacisalsi]|uniref:hypothetical protein n=1 Tax=Gracilibacillus lacisalsi TaxID=393087 RepID=UPI00037818A8|nr:hypothetical protein [Gracilibacillus lacisalsi]